MNSVSPGKHGPRLLVLLFVGHQQADALRRVSRSRQHFEVQLAHLQLVAVFHCNMRKRRPSSTRQIDRGASARRQLAVSGDEICMQMRLEDVPDLHAILLRRFQVNFHVALRIDDDSFALRSQQIRSMRQTAEVELFKIHKDGLSLSTPQKCAQ